MVGPDGWTSLDEQPASRIVYVSNSLGNDANNGLSESSPLKTIAAGIEKLRDGQPDHLLLRRGDTWNEGLGFWTKSGRSLSEPMVVASYGPSTARPRLILQSQPGLRVQTGRVEHVAFTGFHLMMTNRATANAPAGVYWLGPSAGTLIEDCLIEGFGRNLVIQGYFGLIEDMRIRRCVVVDAYDTGTLSQGLYCENTDGIWIEECLFDYNGWHEGLYPQSTLNHNIYIHAECKNLVARGNIIARASSHGLQARPGGLVENNVFVRCPISLSYGAVFGGSPPTVGGVGGAIRGNAFLEGNDIGDLARGIGAEVGNIAAEPGLHIANNLFVRNDSAMPYGVAIDLLAANGVGIHSTTVEGNLCYGYNGGLSAEGLPASYSNLVVRDNEFMPLDTYSFVVHHRYALDPATMHYSGNRYGSPRSTGSWFRANSVYYDLAGWKAISGDADGASAADAFPDSSRSLASYALLEGFEPSVAGFLAEARTQSRQHWRPACTAESVIDYLAVGFGRVDTYQTCRIDTAVAHAPEHDDVDGAPASFIVAPDDACSVAVEPDVEEFAFGQTVRCTASAEPSHRFLYWDGDLLGETTNPIDVAVRGDMNVEAVFVDATEPLFSVDISVVGAGTVARFPGGNAYPAGTRVTLVATPDGDAPDNEFVGFEGDVVTSETYAVVTVDGDMAVRATFAASNSLPASSGAARVLVLLAFAVLSSWRMASYTRRHSRN